jgi:hypothetical protein
VILRRVLVAGALATFGAVTTLAGDASASPSTASPSPTPAVFGLGPASATAVDGRPYYYYLAQPGSQLTDHVAIVNVGTAPLTLSVYATDASNSSDGSFAFPAAAVKPTDAGSWLHVQLPGGGTQVTVKGRSKVFVPVTVTVPGTASPGDHAGALIASLQGEVRNNQGEQIKLDQRVAARVFVRISGPLHPKLAIENLHATYHGSLNPFARGDVTLTYRVHNTGNVKLGATQDVSVSGLFGSVPADAGTVPLLLPGGSFDESVVVHGVLPQVWMSAAVTLHPAGLAGDLDPKASPVSATTHFWAIPLWLLILLVVLAVLGYERYVRRRRRARPSGGPTGPHKPAPADPKPTAPAPSGVAS